MSTPNKTAAFFLFYLALTSAPAFAAGTGETTISALHPWTDGLHVAVSNGVNDPESCGGGNGGFMFLSPDHPQYKLLSSVLLTAFAADRAVYIYTSGCYYGGSKIIGAMAR